MSAQKHFDGEVIYPFDLLDRGSELPMLLDGFVFTRCQIRGPAVLYLQHENQLHGSKFNAGSADELLWEVPVNSGRLGAIVFQRTIFNECWFEGIGLAGTSRDLAPFKAMFGSG